MTLAVLTGYPVGTAIVCIFPHSNKIILGVTSDNC